jgi:RND family efflux transporter MFP subunit
MPTEPTTMPAGGARRPSRRALTIAAIVAACIAALIVVTGIISRAHDTANLKSWTASEAIPVVNVIAPTAETGGQALSLPGTLQAYYNAPIYARVSGYVRAWYKDIGARVKAGQLLATIDTPDLDQQLVQARADLASAKAAVQLAAVTAQRWSKLLTQDAVSRQESDEKSGDLAVKTAQQNAAKANVDRLLALKAFSRIVAPFDGVVTARKTDIGALINAGAGANTTSELFDVAKIDRLRLYVSVPQVDSARIKPGVVVTLTVPEHPGKTFPATLMDTSHAVSDRTGTVLVELLVDNSAAELQAGDFAQVAFQLPNGGGAGIRTVRIPSSALLFRKSGAEVAVVGSDDRVILRPVTIGRDLGSSLEITSGLGPSDRVIDNPPDSVARGELVRVTPTPASPRARDAADAG